MNKTWDEFVTGNWRDDYYNIDQSNEIPIASRVWLYNNGSGLVPPYNYHYDAYQNWAGYENSTGFTMHFQSGIESENADGQRI